MMKNATTMTGTIQSATFAAKSSESTTSGELIIAITWIDIYFAAGTVSILPPAP
jgi:hypothetical protein